VLEYAYRNPADDFVFNSYALGVALLRSQDRGCTLMGTQTTQIETISFERSYAENSLTLLKALIPGGYMQYSTCTLEGHSTVSTHENHRGFSTT